MAFAKPAKVLLIILVAAYVAFLVYFNFVAHTGPEPEYIEALANDIHLLGEKYHGQGARAMNHELSQRIAEEFKPRGPIIGVDYTIVMQWLNFLVLLVVLYGLGWKPLLKLIDQRREQIRNDIKTAREGRESVEEDRAEVRKALAEAQRERRDLRDQSVREAEAERKEMIARARDEAAKLLESARQSIEGEADKARAGLRKYLAEISVSAAERIIDREIRAEDHKQLIDDFLKELETSEL